MNHRRRGQSLGLVLMVAAVALLAAFTAANISTLNLRAASKVSNSLVAENLAESAVQEALAKLQEDLAFEGDISFSLSDGQHAMLTFDDSRGIPHSTNNFLGEHPEGWERTLPDQTIHLLGRGESHGVVKHVEVIAHLPTYPITMACDGPVRVQNSIIGGYDPEAGQWQPGSGLEVDEDDVKPGHLVTNSADSAAIILDEDSWIMGDIQSLGGVRLNGAKVDGEVRSPWGKRAALPEFNIARFDPAQSENIHYEELTSPGNSLHLTGNVRFQGNLDVGDRIFLDNAFLFVDGDLTVDGPMSGVGSVIATGRIEFKCAANMASNEQLAVLSNGGITVRGRGSDRSVFQGLIYTKGPFDARRLTIIGGFIVDNGASTSVQDCSIYFNDSYSIPRMKREVFSVIPRFRVPDRASRDRNLITDDLGFPAGKWEEYDRDVSNVIDLSDPDFQRSRWELDDPGVLRVTWINNQPQFKYEYYGNSNGNPVYGYLGPTTKEDLARALADVNTAPNVHSHLNGTPPNRAEYEAYLLEVMTHLERDSTTSEEFNFALPANEFITEASRIRLLVRRTF